MCQFIGMVVSKMWLCIWPWIQKVTDTFVDPQSGAITVFRGPQCRYIGTFKGPQFGLIEHSHRLVA